MRANEEQLKGTFDTGLTFYPNPWETGTEGAANRASMIVSIIFISSRSGRTSHCLSNDWSSRSEMRES